MLSIVRSHLSKLDKTLFNQCANRTPNSTSCESCFRNMFFSGNIRRYDCSNKVNLYFVRLLNAHIDEIGMGLLQAGQMVNITSPFRHLSVGGGPGTDVVAVNRWLQSFSTSVRQVSVRLDIDKIWDDSANELISKACHNVEYSSILADISAPPLDLGKFNLITISYVITELQGSTFNALGNLISRCLLPDGVLLVNDYNSPSADQRLHSLMDLVGLDCRSSTCVSGRTTFTYPLDVESCLEFQPKKNLNSILITGKKS